ncbi:MAG: hypothetical protein AAF349_24620 [Cyanobacteria bacterium P01_A01_bin.68]
MQTRTQEAEDLTQVTLDKKKEEEKIHDILLLLENLSHREEASIKLIVDSLYDIASLNLINQKFRSRTLKGSLKLIARVSKPAFRIIAWRWYKNNCPRLIVNWLRKKVAFEPQVKVTQQATLEPELVSELQPMKADSLVQLENQTREVRYLRSQVRILTSILVGLIVVFGGTVVWFGYSLERYNLQTTNQAKETNTDKPFASSKGN